PWGHRLRDPSDGAPAGLRVRLAGHGGSRRRLPDGGAPGSRGDDRAVALMPTRLGINGSGQPRGDGLSELLHGLLLFGFVPGLIADTGPSFVERRGVRLRDQARDSPPSRWTVPCVAVSKNVAGDRAVEQPSTRHEWDRAQTAPPTAAAERKR